MKKIISVIGARPQFIKHASMQLQLQRYFHSMTIHTGQHYDPNMSAVFFDELNIPRPDYLFDIGGSKPQSEQTGLMMTEIEKVCARELPDALLIYGDTNSTLAAALVAAKMHIPQIHIEAGLRSFNRAMPEEVNRIVADEFATLLFCPSSQAIQNLDREGISHDGIFLSGDVMCDTLYLVRNKIRRQLEIPYYFATVHRPYNTDEDARLTYLLKTLNGLKHKVVLPIHPRTVARMQSFGLSREQFSNILFIDPVSYVESISYQQYASCVITDSGGMQKEAYMLQRKCITLRSETEWTETLEHGWNTLLFHNLEHLQEEIDKPCGTYIADLYGKGNAAEEIVRIIRDRI
ncbi:non-hydrolyzing UDP-N-acetylglucosamine 2-epimerase [Taibaiella helva]|uniref:non-hydrolyzing UDP-N-acetylglucosamine 2-epimerase n=1 Tax=Taibaiella helva TaxID=2301235 RepID=UPI000E590028|nr:UDP-N-acetylglucosamine 2-epimerase (non-hydrolyzing) [Taibaiella helva]